MPAEILGRATGVELLLALGHYIPTIGFVLGLIPPALLALLQGGVRQAVLVVVAYSVINLVIQSLLQPKVVGIQWGCRSP